jgi:hypothetical protein
MKHRSALRHVMVAPAPLALTILFVACTGDSPTGITSSAQQAVEQGKPIVHSPSRPVCPWGRGRGARCLSHVRTDENGNIRGFAAPQGFGPTDLAAAYNVDTGPNPGLTIAVVDAYGYVNAESDLATYRSQFGLPACSTASGCLTILNGSGATSPLPAQPPRTDDWTIETALDLQMASAACPNCKLLLIEATDDSSLTTLLAGVDTAVTTGATVISCSWGAPDTTDSAPGDEVYLNHPGVGIFVATGDKGYDEGDVGPVIPSTSAYVTAVGATSLVQATGTPRGWTETVWNDGAGASGSSCSNSIPTPSWQASVTTGCTFRAAADVSADGDPDTGVAVYNNGPSNSGWTVVGGTSASSPYVAGVFAVTGNGTVGPSFSYTHTGDFNNVTSGSNGGCGAPLCVAGLGWNGPTGNGTPNGAALAGCTPKTACTPPQNCGTAPDGCGGAINCGTCTGPNTCGGGGTANLCGCTPTTCSALGANCGNPGDGCGGTLSCGTCALPDTCGGGSTANVCGCTPLQVCPVGANCGSIPDGCGGTVNCGRACPPPYSCGGGGTPNACGCTPTTCSALGANCGTPSDGCAGTLSCGACTSPDNCGGGGTANVCGCTPATCSALGANCGTPSDGCGGTLSCGTCTAPDTCAGGGTANVCGCTPSVSACPAPDNCGSISNGCGGTISCGTCADGNVCVQNACVASGVDAGSSGSDASTDSGSADAGSPDASSPDAGSLESPDAGRQAGLLGWQTGCGCGAAFADPSALFGLVFGLGSVNHRRRKRR